jgi:phosphatidylglycerol:prolipoprotein diacylglycerol transferase
MFLLADAYLHALDPFLIEISPGFGIRYYGLAYAVAFLMGWWLIRTVAHKSWSPLPAARVGDLMFAVILGVLIGGRVGYALFYEQHLFFGFTRSFPFWDLLAINKGGMASHGGMIGVILAVVWFGRRHHTSMLHILDLGALGNTPGFFFGRLANFINAELWGKPLPPHMQSPQADPPWWGVKYPEQITERWLTVVNPPRETAAEDYTQLLHSAAADFNIQSAAPSELQTMVVDEARRRLDIVQDQIAPLIGMDDSFFHRVVTLAKDTGSASHDQIVQVIKPLLTAYYPSQIFQMFTDGLFVALLLVLIWLKPRKPGVVGSWYLIIYGAMRMIAETFRQPDAGVELTFGVLSRGQTLSALMILAGLVCLWIASRRNVPRIGGLFAK